MINQRSYDTYSKNSKDNRLIYQSSEPSYHPFEGGGDIYRPDVTSVEIFIPSSYMNATPHKWSDYNRSNGSLMESVIHIIELINYISQQLGNKSAKVLGVFYPDQVATFEVVPKRKELKYKLDENGNEIEDVEASKSASTIAGYRFRLSAQVCSVDINSSNDDSVISEEEVDEEQQQQQDGDAQQNNKKRKKYKRRKQETSIAVIVRKLLEKNKYYENLKIKNRKVDRPYDTENKALDFLFSMTLKQYVGLCSVYKGSFISIDEASATPLHSPENPANPLNVFNFYNSMRKAETSGADYECCRETNYFNLVQDEAQITFPYPDRVWRLNISYLKPGNARKVYWPMVESTNAAHNRQRDIYIQNNTPSMEEEDIASTAFVYDNHIANNVTTVEELSDLDTLKQKHADLIASILETTPDEDERIDRLHEATLKSLNEFVIMCSPDGDGPDALKAIFTFGNNYIADHDHFCMDTVKTSENLTPFGDDMTNMLISLETLWNVNTQHKDAFCLFLKNMHVYALTAFNPHTGNFGPGMAGKSFGFLLVMKWLIPGTFVNTTYSSAKAGVVPGHKARCMLRFYEDVFPAFLGVQGGSKGSETANTDQEAITKALLTSGKLQANVLDTSNGRANATSVEICAKLESVVNICSNTSKNNLPKAMASRYHTNSCQLKDRLEGGGLLGKANKTRNTPQIRAETLFIKRMNRNQCLISQILLLSYVGILPQVDMTVAKMIFTHALKEAKKKGLSGTDDIRSFERLEMVCRVLVVWDAISIVWDSHDSILKPSSTGKILQHKPTDFLLVGRYLRSNAEHAVMTMGLMNSQYEDVIVSTILTDLMSTKFKKNTEKEQQQNKPKTNKKGEPVISFKPSEPGTIRESEDYYIAPFTINTTDKNAKVEGNHINNLDRAKILANAQYSSMRNKPLQADVVEGYQQLLDRMVESVEQKKKKPVKESNNSNSNSSINIEDEDDDKLDDDNSELNMIPALDFKDGCVYLSKHIVKEHKLNALKLCTEAAVNHHYANDAEYVYGTTVENNPFFLETIIVKKTNKPRKVIQAIEPNFFEPALINLTEKYLSGMAKVVETGRNKKAKISDAPKFTLKNAFADLPRFHVDLDWNEYAELHFLEKEYFPPQYFKSLPTGDPLKRMKEVIEHTQQDNANEKLIHYPSDFPQFHPKRYFNAQRKLVRDNPAKYSLKAMITKKINMKQARLNHEEYVEEVNEQVDPSHSDDDDQEDDVSYEEEDDGEDEEFEKVSYVEEDDGDEFDEVEYDPVRNHSEMDEMPNDPIAEPIEQEIQQNNNDIITEEDDRQFHLMFEQQHLNEMD